MAMRPQICLHAHVYINQSGGQVTRKLPSPDSQLDANERQHVCDAEGMASISRDYRMLAIKERLLSGQSANKPDFASYANNDFLKCEDNNILKR